MPSVHDEKAVKDFFGSIAGSNGVFVCTDAKDFVSALGFFEDGGVEVNKVTEAYASLSVGPGFDMDEVACANLLGMLFKQPPVGHEEVLPQYPEGREEWAQ